MKLERITLAELERRMAMLDPYLPRAEIMGGLQALHDAMKEVALWRRIGIASLIVSFIAMAVTGTVLVIGTSEASELLSYQKLCMTKESADLIIKTSEAVTFTNSMCLDQHQKDREFLQAMFARSAEVYRAADKAGIVYAIGEDPYEGLPVMPNAKATDFFLHSEEPGRRAGVMVQAVQQQKP